MNRRVPQNKMLFAQMTSSVITKIASAAFSEINIFAQERKMPPFLILAHLRRLKIVVAKFAPIVFGEREKARQVTSEAVYVNFRIVVICTVSVLCITKTEPSPTRS